MDPTATIDPYIVESYERHRALCKPWVAAAASSHIWSAPLPAGLPSGRHEIVVRMTGEYGVSHSETFVVEIAEG